MTTVSAITRGQIPRGLTLGEIFDPKAHSGLVERELTKSAHANVYLLQGGYVLRSYISEKRGPLAPNVIEVFDMQIKVGDHPYIEPPFFAYQDGDRELFLSGYRNVKNNVVLTPRKLSKILGALLYMDIKGVMHGDLGDFNIGEDQDGDPFIYDFDKAHRINWSTADLHPNVIAFFHFAPPSTLQTEPFNIDLFQNYFVFDQLIVLEEQGKAREARELYQLFLRYSIGYFIKVKTYFISIGLPHIYSIALYQRIEATRKILSDRQRLRAVYEDKMLATFVAAYSWAAREIILKDRTELVAYRDLTRERMESWMTRRKLYPQSE